MYEGGVVSCEFLRDGGVPSCESDRVSCSIGISSPSMTEEMGIGKITKGHLFAEAPRRVVNSGP